MSDVSALAMDAVVDAAFAGDGHRARDRIRRLAAEGIHASVVLGAALRHALMLLSARLAVEEGRSLASVVEGMRGLHFRRKPLVERQLQRWNAATLEGRHRGRFRKPSCRPEGSRRLADTVTAKILLDLARSPREAVALAAIQRPADGPAPAAGSLRSYCGLRRRQSPSSCSRVL